MASNGERILEGSRRPDGTLRKEIRVRAGYVPQDEQPLFETVATQRKKDVPKCPGMDESIVAKAKSEAKTKAARKNEKRKQKKQEGPGSASTSQTSQPGVQAASGPPATTSSRSQQEAEDAALAQRLSAIGFDEEEAQQAGPSASEENLEQVAQLQKASRALGKKIRQCDALVERQRGGETLTVQEQEKLSKLPGWQQEVTQLENEVHALLTHL